VTKKDFPAIHFYDQDFVDIYDQTWALVQDFMQKGSSGNKFQKQYFNYPQGKTINQFESVMSTFFLVYSNRNFPATPQLDNFYEKQEPSGAIRSDYAVINGKPVFPKDNPEGLNPPLFAWAEYNIYHKIGNKKRIREVLPVLEKYFAWLESTFRRENGLYETPLAATKMDNSPRKGAAYLIDFNTQQALSALYMSELGDILNDKDISFKYKKHYFSLKTRINNYMWNDKDGFYYDLDKGMKQIRVKTIASFWPLLAEIPNDAKAEKILAHIKNPNTFGTEHPFPTLAANEEAFEKSGMGFRGSVYPPFTFMMIKGLEKYGAFELARASAIRHLYYMLDALHPEGKEKGSLWEAYAPRSEGHAKWPGKEGFPRPQFLPYTALSTIALMIENIVGLYISLPKKTVDWIIPTMEIMGIENLSLKRNFITILSNKSGRGWEIRLESEKLYYFTIDILTKKKKTLPIPSGKCSMLIDKL
jgi:neutral trehalase